MYDIHHFRRALYSLLLLGMTGFALATESMGLWVLGCGVILLNAWLVKTRRFAPMPRIVSNIITVAGFLWVIHESRADSTTEVIVVGDFLVLLHLVKLYEQRGNRDFAQLLILGLLLMVAGSINTASLLFGIILVVYLFLSLYCCLLFHLKVEADDARAAAAIPESRLNPAQLRQDQRFLNRSMRRVTGLVATVAIVFAVVVFLFFPRGPGGGMLGNNPFHTSETLTGFSSEVSFQQLARITQSGEIVAYAQVWKDDQPVSGADPLLLRGLTLEHYGGDADRGGAKWTWTHVPEDADEVSTSHNRPASLAFPAPGTSLWRQKISLKPTGTNVLFAMAGPISVSTRHASRIEYSPVSGNLQTFNNLVDPIEYEVVSTNSLDPPAGVEQPAPELVQVDPKVLEFAQRPEVSGQNAAGPLAKQRKALPLHVDPLDAEIAANFERYLKTHFTYTLDLTDGRRVEGQDPIVAFLYDLKRGHCEYFAGAMTLMCQSLGMQARMVVGFRCDEYSEMGAHYIVRQSQAHAWVEVRTTNGWKSFDPTSGTEADIASRPRNGFLQRLAHAIDFLRYSYAEKVIAYDNEDRQNVVQHTESRLRFIGKLGKDGLSGIGSSVQSARFWNASSTLIGAALWLTIGTLLVAFGMFVWEKWRLRRRAARIGLDALPPAEQEHLARQLGFYDHLVRMLGKHRIVRPPQLTPLEFSQSLAYLPTDAYQTIYRLTRLFYRVRYGRAELDAGQQKRLETVLNSLNAELLAVAGTAGEHIGRKRDLSRCRRSLFPLAMSWRWARRLTQILPG